MEQEKITVAKALSLSSAITELWALKRPAPPQFGFAVAVNAERLNEIVRPFEKQRHELLTQYGEKDEAGELKTDTNGMVSVSDPAGFNKALSEIREIEASIDLMKVSLDKMPSEIEVDLMARLMPMISED